MPRRKPYNETLLARTLAAHEAAWLPIRSWNSQCPAIYNARRVGIPVGGGGVAERQRISRQRAEMSGAGLFSGSKLTATGRRLARALCWSFETEDLVEILVRFTEAYTRGDFSIEHGLRYVPEQILCGSWEHRHAISFERCILPMLADRIASSVSNPLGAVLYSCEVPDDQIETVVKNAVVYRGVRWKESMAENYDAEFNRCRARILGDARYYNELGGCPVLPNDLASGRSYEDDDFLAGIEPLQMLIEEDAATEQLAEK